ncbi:baseplate protein [Pseudomonas phage vB_PpuM-NoPa]|uniref:Baseplate protein n=1 Tax=Pseudomonas phage vB_PpuM-NoPa TaxID=3132619 RepID=A0AAX4MXA6_9CAUD
MAGLTDQGLVIKDSDEVRNDLNTLASSLFADLVAAGDIVDVSENSTLGRLIGVVTPSIAEIWAQLQLINSSFNPNSATGVALDNIIALSGINRLPAQATRAQVLFEGNNGIILSSPAGRVRSSTTQRTFSITSPVSMTPNAASGVGIVVANVQQNTKYRFSYSVDGVNFIDTEITSPASGATSASILTQIETAVKNSLSGIFTTYRQDGRLFISRVDPFQIVNFSVSVNLRIEKVIKLGLVADDQTGPFEQPANTIDSISVPIAGWVSVWNPTAATTGRYTETDAELRERFRNSKFVQSANIIEALIDALINVAGVSDVIIYENDTDTVNAEGVPMKSFMPIVLGGLPSDIANAIWKNKPTGIGSYGNTTVQIVDSQGLSHPISFMRPTAVPVYIKMAVVSDGTGTLPGDAVALIRQNILDYFEANNKIGDDVIYSRLYTPINQVPGHMVQSLTIGTSANPTGMANIPVAFNQVASITVSQIQITVT